MAADAIIRRPFFRQRARALPRPERPRARSTAEKVLALAPQTFMNDSGRAVQAALQFFKLTPPEVIVIYDEIDLPLGQRSRAKRGGGAGGHNGIRSIDAHIGADYWRVRWASIIPPPKELVKAYVLMDFFKEEHETVQAVLDARRRCDSSVMIAGDDNRFMNKST